MEQLRTLRVNKYKTDWDKRKVGKLLEHKKACNSEPENKVYHSRQLYRWHFIYYGGCRTITKGK